MSKQKIFIIKPLSENTFEGIALERKKGKIENLTYYPTLTLEELKKKEIYLILKPLRFFYEVHTIFLPLFQPKVLRIRLQDRLNYLGYFAKPVDIFWKVISKEGEQYKVAYFAVEKEEIFTYLSKFKTLGSYKIESVTAIPFALSVYLDEKEDSILLHQEKEGVWIIAGVGKLPYIIDFFPVSYELGINWSELNSKINFVITLYYREYQREIKKIILTNFSASEELRLPNLEVLSLEEKYPEYVGVFSIDPAYNFLPEEEVALKEVLKKNYKVAKYFLAFSFLLWGGGLTLLGFNLNLKKDVGRLEALIQESIRNFMSQYPEEKVIAFKNYLEEKERLKNYPHLAELFVKLIKPFQDTVITEFEVKVSQSSSPSQNVSRDDSRRSKETSIREQKLEVAISGYKKASLNEVNSFNERLTKELANILEINGKQIDFSQEEGIINFKINGVVN